MIIIIQSLSSLVKVSLFTLLVSFLARSALSFSMSPNNTSSVVGYNSCQTVDNTFRTIMKIIPKQSKHWVGDGFNVYPVFGPYAFTELLSPWLMFDYASPKSFAATKKRLGVGQHPHRGFETITIAFQGAVEHRDSTGNSGVIGPLDVQWMTAGRGIIHEEFHSTEFAKTGGVFEMCQLWLNLPSKDKMTKPKYQAIVKENIPTIDLKEVDKSGQVVVVGSVRVIAGEVEGTIGPAKSLSPVELWDVSINKKNTPIEFKIPSGHNVALFVRRGKIKLLKNKDDDYNNAIVGPQSVAILNQDGDSICLKAMEQDSQVLLLGGEPLDEPIAARGPFVMNTQNELRQAMLDYQNGRMGN